MMHRQSKLLYGELHQVSGVRCKHSAMLVACVLKAPSYLVMEAMHPLAVPEACMTYGINRTTPITTGSYK